MRLPFPPSKRELNSRELKLLHETTYLPVIPKLTQPFEVTVVADFLSDEAREDISSVDVQYHKGSQSNTVLLGQLATDQRDNVIDLIVTFIQVVFKGLKKNNEVLFPDMIRIGVNKIF